LYRINAFIKLNLMHKLNNNVCLHRRRTACAPLAASASLTSTCCRSTEDPGMLTASGAASVNWPSTDNPAASSKRTRFIARLTTPSEYFLYHVSTQWIFWLCFHQSSLYQYKLYEMGLDCFELVYFVSVTVLGYGFN